MNFALKKEMSPYLEHPRAMPVGTAGKMGYLYLGFELDGEGRSILRDLERHAPLIVQQEQHITLEEGAYLEYLPEPIIPCCHTRFIADTTIRIAPSGTLFYAEIYTSGRTHYTEASVSNTISSRCVPTPRDPTARRFSARSSSFVPTPAPPPRWERWAGTTSSPMSSY